MLKRVAIITSGGDSPGMNPAVRAITRTGLNQGFEIIGIENGYQGIFDRQFIPLNSLEVSGIIRDAGTFLATSRCAQMRTPTGPLEAVNILRKEGIEALVVVGGDGSLTGAKFIHELGFPSSASPERSTTTSTEPTWASAWIPP